MRTAGNLPRVIAAMAHATLPKKYDKIHNILNIIFWILNHFASVNSVRKFCMLHTSVCDRRAAAAKSAIITRFELARAEPIGLAVQRLNHSAI